MEYHLLGPLEVHDGGGELPLGSPLRRALLAILLKRSNEFVSIDRLADLLWEGSPPAAAANVIHGQISDLRRMLGRETIATGVAGYAILVDPDRIDLRSFEVLLEEGSRALAEGNA